MSTEFGNGAAVAPVQTIESPLVGVSSTIVFVEPEGFLTILKRQDKPLVVMQKGGVFVTEYQYLTSYKGLVFYLKSRDMLGLPPQTELVQAKTMNLVG